MDGKTMDQRLLDILNEKSDSSLLNSKATYDFFYDAARDWIIRTQCCTAEQSITTVQNQAAYPLNADYVGLWFTYDLRYYIKLNTGNNPINDTFIEFREREEVYYENDLTPVPISNYFTIMDVATLSAQVSGAASANGAAVGGKCLLTTAADTFNNVSPGDNVHNITDASDGVVISKVDNKNIYIALFGGTGNDVTTADAFIIQPKERMQISLDPPPSVAGYTYTVPYLQLPAPVYSLYDVYRIPFDYTEAFANYAAWKYKERDKQMDFGKNFLQAYMAEVAKYLTQTNRAFARKPVRLVPRFKR